MSSGLNPFSSSVQGGHGVYQIDFEKLRNMQMISSDDIAPVGFQVSKDIEATISPNMNVDFDITREMQNFM